MRIKTRADNGYKYVTVWGRRVSLKTQSSREARRIVKDTCLDKADQAARAGDAARRTIPTLVIGHPLTMTQAASEWADWAGTVGQSALTIQRNTVIVSAWLDRLRLGKESPFDVSEKQINAFINAPGPLSAKTRERQLAAIRSLYRFMAAKGYVQGNPSRLVVVDLRKLTHLQREPKKVRPYTRREVRLLLAGTEGFWRAVAGISYATALRLGDVIQLEWSSVKAKSIVVWTEKRDRRVCLPMTDELRMALEAVPRNDTLYLFPEERAEFQDPGKRAKYSIYFKRELKRLNLVGLTFHGLRHTRITAWRKEGFSLEKCRRFAGHIVVKSTAGYIHE